MIRLIRSWIAYRTLRKGWTQSPDTDCWYRDLWIIQPTRSGFELYGCGRRATHHATLRHAMQTAADADRLVRASLTHSAQTLSDIGLED